MRCVSDRWVFIGSGVMLAVSLFVGDPAFRGAAVRADECIPLPPVDEAIGRYAFFDVLGFQRDNEAVQRPLVNDSVTGNPLLTAGDLAATMGAGSRLFVGTRSADCWGCEAGYCGVYGMTAISQLAGDGNLAIAGPINQQVLPFSDADTVRTTWVSSLNSAEFNGFYSRVSGGSFIDFLGGFRYLNLEEQATMAFTCCKTAPTGPLTSDYSTQTSNNLFGGQIGARARRSWDFWALEGWAKAGVFGNLEGQSQAPIIDPSGVATVVRPALSSRGTEMAFVGDVNATLVYRFTPSWGVRFGYNLLWIDGVALAPNQWDFTTNADAGTALVGGGGVFLHGASVGIEARW